MARTRRRWPLLAAPAAFLVFALIGLRTDAVARLAAVTVETAVRASTGEELSIGRINLSYYPPEIAVEGLVLSHPPTRETILAAPALTVRLGIVDWQPVIQRVTIDRPQVALHIDADGLREFRGLPRGGSGATPREFPWRELRVTDGSFLLTTPAMTMDVGGIETMPVAGRTDLSIGALRIRTDSLDERATAIAIPGAELGPNHIDLPSVVVEFTNGRIDGHLSADLDGVLDGDLSVHLRLPGLTTGVDPRKYVDGVVDVDVTLSGTPAAPGISGSMATQGVVIWRISSKDIPIPTRLGDTVGPWRLDGKVAKIGPLAQEWGGGHVIVVGEVVTDTLATTAHLFGEDVSLAQILQATGGYPSPWVDFRGDVEASVSGSLKPFGLGGPFEVVGTRLDVTSGPVDNARSPVMLHVSVGRVIGDLTLDARHIVLDVNDLGFGPDTRGRARADIGFRRDGPLALDLHLDQLDLGLLQPLGNARLDGRASVDGWLGGSFQALSAHADITGTDLVVLDRAIADTFQAHLESPDLKRLQFTDVDARVARTHWRGNVELAFLPGGLFLDTQVFIPDGWVRDLTGIFVDLGGLDGRISGTTVLSGGVYDLTGEVELELAEMDLWGEKFEGGHVTGWMDAGILTLEELRVARGVETLLARGSIGRKWAMNMEILSDGFRLERLDHFRSGGLPVTGAVVADAGVGGSLFEMEPRGRIALRGTHYGHEPVDDSTLTFRTGQPGVLDWRGDLVGGALLADGHLGMRGEQPYDIAVALRSFPLHTFYPNGADHSRIVATVSGNVDLAGHFGDEPVPVDIDGRLDTVRASWNGHELSNPEPWVFAVHGKSVQIPTIRLKDDHATDVTFSGTTTADGRVALHGEGNVELALARAFAPGIAEAGGIAKVKLTIDRAGDGPYAVRADAKMKNAMLRTDYFPEAFDDLSADLTATPDLYTFRTVKAVVGGGKFTAEGTIGATDWWPNRYALDGSLAGSRIQYLEYLPPLTGNAKLRFDGPVGDLLLSGDIDIDDMAFRDRVDWESKVLSLRGRKLTDSASKERTDWFSMDLHVIARDGAHFRNNLADADASADLTIVGDTARPGMVGEIRVTPGGRMYLQDRQFEVTRGELRYVDPYSFDPDLDILLETDVKGRDQDYHVYYAITGPFSDWRTNTTADPYLSQADINTLLLFGMTREEFERYGGIGAALAAQTTDLLATQLIDRGPALIDRWSLVSGVNERGSTTLSSDLRLVAEKDLFDFSITGESNFDQDWYLSIERRIAQNLYASAYAVTQQEGRSLPIGAAYGAEFKYRWEFD